MHNIKRLKRTSVGKLKVFISYTAQNNAIVQKVARNLRRFMGPLAVGLVHFDWETEKVQWEQAQQVQGTELYWSYELKPILISG